MELEANEIPGFGIESGDAKASIFQQFQPRECGAKSYLERFPVAGISQSRANPPHWMPEKTDGRRA